MFAPSFLKATCPSGAWNSRIYSLGIIADKRIRVACGHATFARITSLPLKWNDPDGPGSDRPRRYAHHLWGAMASSLANDDGTTK